MTRTALPDRRQNLTREVGFGGRSFTLTVGYDPAGAPKEVFVDGHREGSDMQALLSDVAVLVSIALQHGVPPAELAKSLATVPVWQGGAQAEGHASPVGVIVEALEPRPSLGGLR